MGRFALQQAGMHLALAVFISAAACWHAFAPLCICAADCARMAQAPVKARHACCPERAPKPVPHCADAPGIAAACNCPPQSNDVVPAIGSTSPPCAPHIQALALAANDLLHPRLGAEAGIPIAESPPPHSRLAVLHHALRC